MRAFLLLLWTPGIDSTLSTTDMAPSVDVRAQILANATALFLNRVKDHVLKYGHAALDASKVFAVILLADTPQNVPENPSGEVPSEPRKYIAQLVERDVDNPFNLTFLVQSDASASWAVSLERLLKEIVERLADAGHRAGMPIALQQDNDEGDAPVTDGMIKEAWRSVEAEVTKLGNLLRDRR